MNPGEKRDVISALHERYREERQRDALRGATRIFRQAVRDVEAKSPSAAIEKLIEALAKPDPDAATAALQEVEQKIQWFQLTLDTVRDVIKDFGEDLRPQS